MIVADFLSDVAYFDEERGKEVLCLVPKDGCSFRLGMTLSSRLASRFRYSDENARHWMKVGSSLDESALFSRSAMIGLATANQTFLASGKRGFPVFGAGFGK